MMKLHTVRQRESGSSQLGGSQNTDTSMSGFSVINKKDVALFKETPLVPFVKGLPAKMKLQTALLQLLGKIGFHEKVTHAF